MILDKNYLRKLKEIDTSNVAFSIAEIAREQEELSSFRTKASAVAYVLYQSAVDASINVESKSTLLDSINATEDIKKILDRNLTIDWDNVTSLAGKFSADELLSYLLFNNDYESGKSGYCSTPEGVLKLACSLLNIKAGDKVLDLCSGNGNFFIEAYTEQDDFKYTGIELNFNCNDVAQIRGNLLKKDVSLVLSDALEYRTDEKADKIFANYPFGLKNTSLSEFREKLRESLDVPVEVLQRASSDWIFNTTIIEQMKKSGKAVAIMTNGATWNATDKGIRQYFVENGLIEAVIALPAKLFACFSIPTTLVVFSYGNKEIKMVDASDIYTKERKINVLSGNDIERILQLLSQDGELSCTKELSEIADNEYFLSASRYLKVLPEFENGVELGTVTKNITRGVQIKAKDLDDLKSNEVTDYKYLSLSNINDGILAIDDGQYLKEIPSNMKKFCVNNNAIVLARTGLPEFKSAVAQINENIEVLATGNLFVIELDETKVNPFYLQAFFASDTGATLLKSISTGSNLLMISLDKLNKLVIPLPPIEEQNIVGNKYAAAMDESILLKRKLEKSISRMKHVYDEEAE